MASGVSQTFPHWPSGRADRVKEGPLDPLLYIANKKRPTDTHAVGQLTDERRWEYSARAAIGEWAASLEVSISDTLALLSGSAYDRALGLSAVQAKGSSAPVSGWR